MQAEKLIIKRADNLASYPVYYVKTDKFKSTVVGTLMFTPFQKEELAERSVLSALMTKSNSEYPDEQAFNIYLQNNYNMEVSAAPVRNGKVSMFALYVTAINSKYLETDVDLFHESMHLLQTTLTKVDFDKAKIAQEKSLLIQELQNVYNNKAQYATQQFIKAMFKDETLSMRSTGEIEDIEKVNVSSIKKAHQHLLTFEQAFIVIGDLEKEQVETEFSKLTIPPVSTSLPALSFLDLETKVFDQPQEIVETQNINQSIICMGYRSEIRVHDELYNGMFLLNGMLGAFFHSTLFQEIREKRSLAYYVGSDYNSRKGNLAVIAAVEKNNYEEVVRVVKETIKNYQDGKIDDEIIELTKKAYINKILKGEDAILAFVPDIINEIANFPLSTVEEKIARLNKITKEEVIKAANCLRLDTIYFLKGDPNEESL